MKRAIWARIIAIGLPVLVLGACASPDRPTQLMSGAEPVYPSLAQAEGIEGAVVIRYGVALDGRVGNARVDSAEPEGIFEQAALDAVRSWRFNPAIRDGKPTSVANVVSTVRFRLDDDDFYEEY